MHSCETNWEDSENNRRVDLTVTYVADGEGVKVNEITPTRVTFLCPESREAQKSISVHREKARSILVRQLIESGGAKQLELELLSQHAEMP